jgi:hypothetical protein
VRAPDQKLVKAVHVAGAEEEVLQPLEEGLVAAVLRPECAQVPSSRRRLGLLFDRHRALFSRRVAGARRRVRRRVLGGRRRRGLPREPLDELAEVPGLRLDDLRLQDVHDLDLITRRGLVGGDGVGEPVHGNPRRRAGAGRELRRGVLHGESSPVSGFCMRTGGFWSVDREKRASEDDGDEGAYEWRGRWGAFYRHSGRGSRAVGSWMLDGLWFTGFSRLVVCQNKCFSNCKINVYVHAKQRYAQKFRVTV